eukprot:529157-Rhodomonas_salina.1
MSIAAQQTSIAAQHAQQIDMLNRSTCSTTKRAGRHRQSTLPSAARWVSRNRGSRIRTQAQHQNPRMQTLINVNREPNAFCKAQKHRT